MSFDSKKTEEAIYIILAYCIHKNIQLPDIFTYLNMDKKVHNLIKLTKFKSLIQYFILKPELNDICLLFNLKGLQYQNYTPKNKDLQLYEKFTIFESLQKYLNKPGTSKNRSINQSLLIESNFPLKYIYSLRNIAISQIYFPQIIYAIQIDIFNNIPIFTICPTQILQKALNYFKEMDFSFQTQELNFENIIETILSNVIRNYQHESFNDAQIIQKIQKMNFDLLSQYSNSSIFALLLKIKKLQNCDRLQFDTRNLDKNILLVLKYIEISLNFKKAIPSLIKYLCVSNKDQNAYYFTIGRQNIITELFELDDLNLHLNKLKTYTQNQLSIQFPELLNVKFQHSQIVQMLQLIYNKKDQIEEELSQIFKELSSIQLVNDIFMYNLQESCGFIIICQLNNYFSDHQITQSFQINHSSLKMTEIDRCKALSTLRLLLRMMVEQDVIIPELIQFIKVSVNKLSVYQFKMIQSRNMLQFIENDVRIMNLKQIYNFEEQVLRSGKKIINFNQKQVRLQNKYYEFQCILNRMEAIDKHKDKFKSKLIQIFQLNSVQTLFYKLNQLRVEFTVEQQPYVQKGYQILISIKRFIEELND